MSIAINETSDWKELPARGLGTVVDPLVFRCGELFLKGASDAQKNPEAVWELLNLNMHAVGMFFDALVINEKLPVFNYGDTFDGELNFDDKVLTSINKLEENDPVLYDVDVGYQAYHEVKRAALAELEKIFNGEQKIPDGMFDQIFNELSAASYRWSPGLENLEQRLQTIQERTIADFMLGGLIFGGYAQQMDGEHLLQPKRSRLFLALSLQSNSAGYEVETELFEELKKRANSPVDDLPWRPTFFPYLLSKAEKPADMLPEVVKLRRSPEVRDYRQWFAEVIEDWKRDGKISSEKRRDVKAIVESVDYRLGNTSSLPSVEVKVKVAAAVPGELNVTPALKRMWGWILSSLPGKRYRKLLSRAIVADSEYVKLENRIKTVWKNG